MANRENARNNARNGASDGERGASNDDSIAKLLRLAGPRASVPADVEKRVHDAVRNEWESAVGRRRTFRWVVPVALAATIALAVALSNRAPHVSVTPIATVALVDGDAVAPGSRYTRGDEIFPGDAIMTGNRGLALDVSNGISLRLAAGTTAMFESAEDLSLESGRVYADTGFSGTADRSITIHTTVGAATDVGTQFAVAFLDGDMSVAVREGRVDVSDNRGSYAAEAGDLLVLQPDDDVVYDRISIYDSAWDWATDLAPAFEIDNRRVLDFLKWAARETGRELVFESEEARITAMERRLRGTSTTAGMTPSEALHAVLPTTSFVYRVDEHQIVIGSSAR